MQVNFSPNLLQQLQALSPKAREQLLAEAAIAAAIAKKAQAYINPDPIDWITTHFFIPELKAPIELYPVQIAALKEALSTDDAGQFKYSTVVWSALKKSAKSTIAAAVGLWFAFQRDWSTVKIIANDIKQAESRVAYYMRRAITLHPEWSKSCKVINYKIQLPNHSTIEAIPIDPSGEAGGNDDLLIFSELWGWKNKAALKMWTEATLSPLKFGKSLRWIETYAGFVGESPILEGLYDGVVKPEYCIDAENELYANPSQRIFALWNTRPSTPFQTDNYYAQEESILMPNEYNRVHKNEWGTSSDAFVQPEWWDACAGDIPPYQPGEQMVIALDAAVSGDCFALVGVTRRNEMLYAREVHIWQPTPGNRVNFRDVEAMLKELTARHNVICVTYDPYQLHDLATRLQEELGVWFDEFPQTAPRLEADVQLRHLIMGLRLVHDGNPELRAHVLNADAKTDGDHKLRLIKRNERLKIDAAVALSMACARALDLDIG